MAAGWRVLVASRRAVVGRMCGLQVPDQWMEVYDNHTITDKLQFDAQVAAMVHTGDA